MDQASVKAVPKAPYYVLQLEKIFKERYRKIVLAADSRGALLAARPELTRRREAMDRIKRGEFGNCLDCRQPIPYPRLIEQPGVELCECCQVAHKPVLGRSAGRIEVNKADFRFDLRV